MAHSQVRYALIPRTLVFITNSSNELLLIRGNTNKSNWPNLYNAVGGHIEPGETIDEAARREIREETGIIELEHLALRGTIAITNGNNPGILLFIFTAQTSTKTLQNSPEGTPEWLPVSSLAQLPLVPDIPDLVARVLSPNAEDVPALFHAHYEAFPNQEIRTRFS